MFCTQTNTDACTQTHVDTHRHTRMHANVDARRRKQTSLDKCGMNCVQCVGRHNRKMHPDVRHLFKDFWHVLYMWGTVTVKWNSASLVPEPQPSSLVVRKDCLISCDHDVLAIHFLNERFAGANWEAATSMYHMHYPHTMSGERKAWLPGLFSPLANFNSWPINYSKIVSGGYHLTWNQTQFPHIAG